MGNINDFYDDKNDIVTKTDVITAKKTRLTDYQKKVEKRKKKRLKNDIKRKPAQYCELCQIRIKTKNLYFNGNNKEMFDFKIEWKYKTEGICWNCFLRQKQTNYPNMNDINDYGDDDICDV